MSLLLLDISLKAACGLLLQCDHQLSDKDTSSNLHVLGKLFFQKNGKSAKNYKTGGLTQFPLLHVNLPSTQPEVRYLNLDLTKWVTDKIC